MDNSTPDRLGDILETMQPRMEAHKRGYLRARFGVALAVPLILVGGIAFAAQEEPSVSQVADGGGLPVPAIDTTDADDTILEDKSVQEKFAKPSEPEGKPTEDKLAEELDGKAAEQKQVETIEVPVPPREEASPTQTVQLGLAGTANVVITDDTFLTLTSLDLHEGWEASELAGKEGYVVLELVNGDVKLKLTLKVKVKTGEMKVKFKDLNPPEETPVKKPSSHTKPAPAANSASYSSAGGSVSVTSNGGVVSISVTGTTGGWTHEVLYPSGEFAKVRFISVDRSTFIYVMGQLKDGKLVVGEWTEHSDWYAEQDANNKKKKKNG
jgi:hypothetical protein